MLLLLLCYLIGRAGWHVENALTLTKQLPFEEVGRQYTRNQEVTEEKKAQ